jgi:hypothetical protein
MAIKKAIYLSYDLGLKGDYNGLYAWLDSLEAKECGNSIALFQKEFDKNDHEFIYEELKKEIEKNIKLESNDRMYMILQDKEGLIKGKFIFGGRKKAPWEGFAVSEDNSEDSF